MDACLHAVRSGGWFLIVNKLELEVYGVIIRL